MIHPWYTQLVQEVYGKNSIVDGIPNSYLNKSFEKSISDTFYTVDNLQAQIVELKEKHTNEMLELKLKLSNLIDTNYNLLQQLNKESR